MSGDARLDTVLAARRRYDDRVAAVRADGAMSDDGRRRALAKAWLELTDALKPLHADAMAERDRTRKALEARLLRPAPLGAGAGPSERIARDASFRDALDRAEKAESSDELLALLHRAHRSDDPLQVRACLAVAFDRQDLRVVNAHVEANPAESNDVKELVRATGPARIEDRIEMSRLFSKPPVPAELRAENEFTMRRIAASDTPEATASPS